MYVDILFFCYIIYLEGVKMKLLKKMIQAQRDYFGAHTYKRKDKEGTFHYSWYDEK